MDVGTAVRSTGGGAVRSPMKKMAMVSNLCGREEGSVRELTVEMTGWSACSGEAWRRRNGDGDLRRPELQDEFGDDDTGLPASYSLAESFKAT